MDSSVLSYRRQLEHTGFGLTKISGKSMRPLIWGGQHYVAIVPLEDEEPVVGDLLAFKQTFGGREVGIVHRLVEISKDGDQPIYITRGDNCLCCEIISRSEIIGRVAEVHRISGFRPWHAIPSRQFSVTDPAYLRYSRFWSATWPARRLYYLLRGHVNGLRVRLMSIFKR